MLFSSSFSSSVSLSFSLTLFKPFVGFLVLLLPAASNLDKDIGQPVEGLAHVELLLQARDL